MQYAMGQCKKMPQRYFNQRNTLNFGGTFSFLELAAKSGQGFRLITVGTVNFLILSESIIKC